MRNAGGAPLLRVAHLERRFSAGNSSFLLMVEALQVSPGQTIAVVGPSGCGKSSMLALLSLALAPDAGRNTAGHFELMGQDVLALWQRRDQAGLTRLRAATIGFVPQTAALLPFLSLRDNITLPQRLTGMPDAGLVRGLAEWLRIDTILDRKPAQVSVGQRQRAAVARALVHRPSLVLADEPTASVHPAQADEILQLLTHVAHHTGAALLITTHDHARAQAAGFQLAPFDTDRDGVTSRFRFDPASAYVP